MTDVEDVLARAVSDLDASGGRWALIGGMAVGARAEPRFTKDIDVAVAVDTDADAEALVHHLRMSGYEIQAVIEQDAAGRMSTVRLAPVGREPEDAILDLLFASSGIENEIVAAAERINVTPNLTVPVARTGHLIALKLLARSDHRPLDAGDLLSLLRIASPDDVERAREAVGLIVERGYNRGRDLARDLEDLLERRPWEDGPELG